MAIITPPAPLPLRQAKWRENVPAQVNRSGWTGARKVVGLPGAPWWSVTGTFVTQIGEAKARPWRAFFSALQGSLNTFQLRASENQQTTSANPYVRVIGDGGKTLQLAGLPVSTAVLPSGSLFTVSHAANQFRMRVLTAALVSDASGYATATFGSELGVMPPAFAACEIQWPFALMALTSEPPGWDVDVGQLYSFTLAAEEAL